MTTIPPYRCGLASAAFAACLLLVVSTSAWAQGTYTYQGGGGNTNTNNGANYSGGTAPTNAQTNLHFNVSGGGIVNNNFSDYGPGFRLYFDNGSGSVDLSGNAIKFYDFGSAASLIQNNSSNDQTIQARIGILRTNTSALDSATVGMDVSVTTAHNLTFGDSVATAQSVFFDESAGFLRTSGVANSSVIFNSALVNGDATGKVMIGKSDTPLTFTTVFNAVNTYTGETDVNGGTLRINAAPNSGTSAYYVGNGATTPTAAALLLGGTSVTFNNPITENGGSGSNRIIGGLNTSGTNAFTGTLTVSDNNLNLVAAAGGTVTFATITASAQRTISVGNATSTGLIQFGGTADNLNIGASVSFGTLSLAKTSSSTAHAVGAGLAVNSGGTVLLGGSGGDQIFDGAAVTLNGGEFDTAGLSERVGALTLASTSTIDLGTGTSSLIFGGTSTRSGGNLAFTNYTLGTDHVFFYNASTGTAAYTVPFLSNITLNGFGVNELASGEIVPAPEPATWCAGLLTLGAAIYGLRRRLRAPATV